MYVEWIWENGDHGRLSETHLQVPSRRLKWDQDVICFLVDKTMQIFPPKKFLMYQKTAYFGFRLRQTVKVFEIFNLLLVNCYICGQNKKRFDMKLALF